MIVYFQSRSYTLCVNLEFCHLFIIDCLIFDGQHIELQKFCIIKVFHPRLEPLPNVSIAELGITELFYYGL